ncbi:MAG: lipid II flippase MurJ, partial [Patescibacteria group bacterium]
MVRRILRVFTEPIRGLHQAAYLLAFFSLLSQILGLVRDRAFAHMFGAGPVLDAYFAAFKVPDLVFALLTLFVSSFALVPLLSGRDAKGQGVLVGNVLVAFGAVAITASAALWFAMPSLIPVLFPGFDKATTDDIVLLSRIMLAQPVLLGLSSIAASVIHVLRRFLVYAVAPIFYNVGIIIGIVFLYPSMGVAGLAWGVVLGAVFHFATQMPSLSSAVVHMERPTLASLGSSVADVALSSLPRSLALSAQQVLLIVFVGIASFSAVGAVATLSFALNLQSVPLSIVGLSYAAAIFPALASLFASGDRVGFAREVWAGIRHIAFWTAPAIALLIVLRAQIVRVVLGSGEFSWDDTRLTAAILALFSVSLISQAAILVFSRAYYAARETLAPILVNVTSALAAAALAYVGVVWVGDSAFIGYFLESMFRVVDTPGTSVLMIPVAYSAVIILASVWFGFLFAKRFGFESSVPTALGQSFAASVIGAAGAYLALQLIAPLVSTDTFLGIFLQGLGGGVSGIALWALTLALLKNKALEEVVMLLKKKGGSVPTAP